jgi:hypothetical protein
MTLPTPEPKPAPTLEPEAADTPAPEAQPPTAVISVSLAGEEAAPIASLVLVPAGQPIYSDESPLFEGGPPPPPPEGHLHPISQRENHQPNDDQDQATSWREDR